MKRLTALLLSFLIILALCVPTMAASGSYNYLVLGDSVPHNMKGEYLDPVDLRYPALVTASLTDLNNDINAALTNLSLPGIRTDEMRILLEDNYEGDDFTEYFLEGYVDSATVTKDLLMSDDWRTMYRNAIRSADLVSIELGNNDLLGNLLYAFSAEKFDFGSLADLFKGGRIDPSFPIKLVKMISSVLKSASSLAKYPLGLQLTFRENWDCIIRDIRKLNPTATIVVVGFYNPYSTKAEMPDGYAQLSGVAGLLIGALDNYIKDESPYKHEYLYVDVSGISDVEGAFDESSDNDFAFHPGPIGHQYIAQQILNVLAKNSQPCIHEKGAPKNVFRFFRLGYTGDVYCKHCGMLLGHGTFTSLAGKTFELPKTIRSDVYSFIAAKLTKTVTFLLRI